MQVKNKIETKKHLETFFKFMQSRRTCYYTVTYIIHHIRECRRVSVQSWPFFRRSTTISTIAESKNKPQLDSLSERRSRGNSRGVQSILDQKKTPKVHLQRFEIR